MSRGPLHIYYQEVYVKRSIAYSLPRGSFLEGHCISLIRRPSCYPSYYSSTNLRISVWCLLSKVKWRKRLPKIWNFEGYLYVMSIWWCTSLIRCHNIKWLQGPFYSKYHLSPRGPLYIENFEFSKGPTYSTTKRVFISTLLCKILSNKRSHSCKDRYTQNVIGVQEGHPILKYFLSQAIIYNNQESYCV